MNLPNEVREAARRALREARACEECDAKWRREAGGTELPQEQYAGHEFFWCDHCAGLLVDAVAAALDGEGVDDEG